MKYFVNFKSPYLLTKIIWSELNNKNRLQIISVILFSIFSSFIQYLYILITALTFAFLSSSTTIASAHISEIINLFGLSSLNNNVYITIISIWLFISFSYHLSAAFCTVFIYRISYDIGRIISEKILKISIASNSIFHENLSKKTLFNLLTQENTMLINGSISALIGLPMQLSIVIALISIILKFSISLFIVIPIIGLSYVVLSSLLLNIVRKNSVFIFNYRSQQTDLLTRFIDNYLDVSLPPSNLTYRKLFNKLVKKLRRREAYNATIPKILKNFLELIVILTMGFYCIYALKIINIPINSFISSSAAIILSILKLTPVLSAISSTFIAFENQYETIKKYYEIFKNQNKYKLNSDKYIYPKVIYDNNYSLTFNSISNLRINKLSKKNALSKQFVNPKLIWITGRSGCGKSTLFSMIAGIRPITSGEIILSLNKSEKENSYSQNIYDHIAYMPQKPIFHSITIRDYIKDGDNKIDDRSISKIIKILELSKSFNTSDIELLDLVIGPSGFAPSGGQAKLISFARTLCKRNVELYLLDEPTSDLNKELREIVLNCIYDLSKRKFILSITHDLSSIRSNDEVIKL